MNEIANKRHSFDLAKERLKEFSEKTEAELKVEMVQIKGSVFGIFNHKVTGGELNRRLETIQGHFINVNSTNNKVIKEFREIYNVLDALDKDYLTSIVANVKAIEKTSNDVRVQQMILKQHNEKLEDQQSKLDVHQAEIGKNVANISKIVTTLKQMHQNELDTLAIISTEHKESIDMLFNKLADAEDYAVNSRNSIAELESFRTKISTLNHLMEVDDIWKKTDEHEVCIKKLEHVEKIYSGKLDKLIQTDSSILQRIDLNEKDINNLKEYKEKLGGISHLKDVDNIWKSVEEHTSQLTESEKRDEELATAIQKNKDEVDNRIADVVQTAHVAVESLTKKVKYAYLIAGGSAGLAIIELILLLMKVI